MKKERGKKTRRSNGEGSISSREDGRFQASRRYEGKRYYGYGSTKSEALADLRAKIETIERGTIVPSAKLTVRQYMNEWLEDVRKLDYRIQSYRNRESIIKNYINPELGDIPLSKLTPRHIQRFVADMSKHLAPVTVRARYTVLHAAIRHAIKIRMLSFDPCIGITLPPIPEKEYTVLDVEQAERLLVELDGHWLKDVIILALSTGMRKGELSALKWKDIHFEEGYLMVSRNLSYVPGEVKFVEGDAKTKKSKRKISLTQYPLDMLKRHRLEQKEARLKAGSAWQDHDLVFCNAKGGYLVPGSINRAFLKALASADLPAIPFHNVRHSAASVWFALKIDPKIIQELLGHSSIKMTMDLYTHLMPNAQQDAIQRMDEGFWGQMQG